MSEHTIAFIGGGNMARSLIGGMIADGFAPERIRVADPDAGNRDSLGTAFGVRTMADNTTAAAGADAVVLAVKPQVMAGVAAEIGPQAAADGAVVLSIAAGIREQDLSRWLAHDLPVIRAMPNTPSLLQSGATALYANARVTEAQRQLATAMLDAVGLTCWLDDEALMDAVTAVSGSGPAYFFYLMELIADSGERLGLPRETARQLSLQTALGAARMALDSDEDPAALRRRVMSPGGTTEQAISTLTDGGLPELVDRAVNAAATRAAELGDDLGRQD
ncbi:MAG: pyrroline-5-carboxylate reductase [Ectothiorhodospiraceae bacterium]